MEVQAVYSSLSATRGSIDYDDDYENLIGRVLVLNSDVYDVEWNFEDEYYELTRVEVDGDVMLRTTKMDDIHKGIWHVSDSVYRFVGKWKHVP